MTTSGGYQVDVDVLTDAAVAGTTIARDAGPLPKELATALDELAAGAPKTLSGRVAARGGQWADALGNQVDQVQDLGEKLKQTVDDYLREDDVAAQKIGAIDPVAASGASAISAVLDGLI